MITTIFGLPGSGKTTFLAACAARAAAGKSLRCGLVPLQSVDKYDEIYSNAPIKGVRRLPLEYLGTYAPRRSLVLIDESVMIADSRDYKNLDRSLMMFMKQHRKYSCDILLASQGYKDNDLRIRDLAAQVCYVRSKGFGLSTMYCVDKTIAIDKTIEERYDLGGLFHQWTIRRKKYYPLFDTMYIHGKPLPEMPDLPKW